MSEDLHRLALLGPPLELGVEGALPAERFLAAERAVRDKLNALRAKAGVDVAEHVRHGRAVTATAEGSRAALVDGEGSLVAVAERSSDLWWPRVVLNAS